MKAELRAQNSRPDRRQPNGIRLRSLGIGRTFRETPWCGTRALVRPSPQRRGMNWRRERDCSRRGTVAHPSLTLGTALRASRFAPQISRTRLFLCSRVRIPRGQWHCPADHAVDFSTVKSGGREGFIPLPKVHELQRFANIPEYSYLRKYLDTKTSNRTFKPTKRGQFCTSSLPIPNGSRGHRVRLIVRF